MIDVSHVARAATAPSFSLIAQQDKFGRICDEMKANS